MFLVIPRELTPYQRTWSTLQSFGFCLFWDRVSHNLGWPQTHCTADEGLELLIYLLLPPSAAITSVAKPVYVMLGTKTTALCTLGKGSTSWSRSPTPNFVLMLSITLHGNWAAWFSTSNTHAGYALWNSGEFWGAGIPLGVTMPVSLNPIINRVQQLCGANQQWGERLSSR